MGYDHQIPPTQDHDCLAQGIKDAANVQAFSNLNLRKSRGTEKNSNGRPELIPSPQCGKPGATLPTATAQL